MRAYVVMTSNCERWEDYCVSVDSVWLDRENAVRHIEGKLGMRQVDFRSDESPWSRDRWLREELYYLQRDEEESDEEWESLLDDDGNPPVIDSYSEDAWIEEFDIEDAQDGR